MNALAELGLNVPGDISVVGYDGVSITSEENLTTISLPFYGIGCKALNLLLDYYENGKTERNSHLEIATSLVVKKTLSRVKYNHGKDER